MHSPRISSNIYQQTPQQQYQTLQNFYSPKQNTNSLNNNV